MIMDSNNTEQWKADFKALGERMEKRRLEWRTVPGEWPPADAFKLQDTYKGFKLCALCHHCVCGYLGLPPGHKYFGADYDDVPYDVHGGWTFEQLGNDGYYWIGFDTAHYNSGSWTSDMVMDELRRVIDGMDAGDLP